MGFDPDAAVRIVAEASDAPVSFVQPGDVVRFGGT
jgi:hypothetical protein